MEERGMGALQSARAGMIVNSLEIISYSAAQTRKVGKMLGELAAPGDVILLIGPLGIGKTCLAQGIAYSLAIEDYAMSPSFVLVREYQGRLPLYHIDFYRLDRIEEIAQLGLDDYLYGSGVCVIEWADKGLDTLPDEHLIVQMQYLAPTRRKITLVPKGPRYVEMLSQLRIARQAIRNEML